MRSLTHAHTHTHTLSPYIWPHMEIWPHNYCPYTVELPNNGHTVGAGICPLYGGCSYSEDDLHVTPLNPKVESVEWCGMWEVESVTGV